MASSYIRGYGDHDKSHIGLLGSSMEMMNVPATSHLEDGSSDNNKSCKRKKEKASRIAFQTRTQVDILDDGYRWRKYGQKAVKDNKFPRSYYKCTHQGCKVKKQVQRKAGDEGVVVTTYVGVHSHPIDKPTDNFEQILTRMRIYTPV